jgi:hypothetical protein
MDNKSIAMLNAAVSQRNAASDEIIRLNGTIAEMQAQHTVDLKAKDDEIAALKAKLPEDATAA